MVSIMFSKLLKIISRRYELFKAWNWQGQPIWLSFWSFFSLFSAWKSYRTPMFPISVMSHCHLGSLWDKDSPVHRTEKNEYSASFLCRSPRRDHLHTGGPGETSMVWVLCVSQRSPALASRWALRHSCRTFPGQSLWQHKGTHKQQ